MSGETKNNAKSKWGAVSFQRRRFPRIDITLPVEYNIVETKEDIFKTVVAQNISSGGLLLVLPDYQPASTCMKIRIYLGVRSVEAEVQVAWTEILTGREMNEYRCGVYFTNISGEDLDVVKEFVTEYMEREK